MPDCVCDDALDSVHQPECPIHVDCDQKCRALIDPATLKECKDALDHWRSHGYLHGCSHGC